MPRDAYYEYFDDGKYCYPGTYVLRNKLGLTDSAELLEAERSITSIRIAQLDIDDSQYGKPFDAARLCEIHRFIFSDIYDWAGKYRTVNISKGSMFCAFQYIPVQVDKLMAKLACESPLDALSQHEIAVRLAYYLGEINAIHPFREGNGRTQRAFVRKLAYENGWLLSFANVSDNEMIEASMQSFNGNNAKLEAVIEGGLRKL
ncbi:MAG: Fic/DOC family protein [Coriobacteriales bacterium]|jgi:cell filamentation protein